MSKRSWSWILVCLLLLAGAWLFWPAGNRQVAQKSAATKKPAAVTTRSASTAPLLFVSGKTATNGVVKTNAFAYRLTNTKKSIGQLANDPHAILLENALMDTRVPLNFSIPKNLQAQGDPGAYIVQANGPIDAAFRATLAAAGAQIVSYIPNNAYLVTVSAGGAAGLAGRPGVQSVLPYEPRYKISSSLLGLAVEQKNLPDNAVLTLGLFPNTASQTVDQIKQLGGTVVATDESPFGPIVRVSPPKNWTALAGLPGVQIMELAHRRALANDLARVTLGISTDTVTNADYMNLFGSNVVVEVNDTGIDAKHPDFTTGGSPATGAGGAPIRVIGDSALSLVDTNGHGTHVAGIIAGNGDKSWGTGDSPQVNVGAEAQGSVTNADFRGKARAAQLYSVAALNNSGSLDIPDSYLQSVPAQTNALISNNSWAYTGDNTYNLAAASYDAAVRDALPLVTGSQPVLFVFAAGNNGGGDDSGFSGDADTILSPGTAKDVITVGALEQFRNITNTYTPLGTTNQVAAWQDGTSSSYEVAGYSSRGNVGIGMEGTAGRFKPDVVAPGSFVVSTRSEQWDQAAYYNPTNDNFTEFPDFVQPQSTSDPNSASFFVYNNSPVVTIQLRPLATATSPLPDLPIYVWEGTDPNTATPVLVGTNSVTILTLNNVDVNWSCSISNPTTATVRYNLIVDVLTTNDLGDYFTVLSNLNNTIGPWYRYESGTSMATPAVSGSLALIQDYFTNTLHATPSPALLKAMLINGARSLGGGYYFTVTNAINFQGWGLANVPDSVPPALTNRLSVACSELFLDQNVTNALATGDSQTYLVTVTNSTAQDYPLRVTLAWTDPPGNPAAAIKLVNNLDLMVSNNVTGDVYFGNDIPANSTFNQVWNTNVAPNLDAINNVENVFLNLIPSGSYTVTVIGRSVNVNAVTAQTNNVVQDYALVIAYGEGEVTNAITVAPGTPASASNPTGDQQITTVLINANGMATNSSNGGGVFLNQLAGANTPLLGTNQVPALSNYTGNAVVTLGMTNQWHFYVVQNTTGFSNAAFVTFLPDTLSMPRMGVFADPTQNPTQPEADIDMYVSTDPSLTNLNPVVISNCVNGTQIGASVAGTFNGASLSSGGTEFVVDTNSRAGEPYYVGVKSETAIAAEYGFLPVFSQEPFSQSGPNGETVNGLLLPMTIPDGNNAHPGTAYIFALAIQPIQVQDVIVSNEIVHEDFGDLVGTLSHNGKGVVLNNHELLGDPPGPYSFSYYDGPQPPQTAAALNSQNTAGPGSLAQFQGQQGVGPWILTEVDNASPGVGYVTNFSLLITPHQNLNQGVNIAIQPGGYFYGFIDVPVGTTNLTISATNISGTTLDPNHFTLDTANPGQLFEKLGEQPAPPPVIPTNFDKMVTLTNTGPLGPGGSIVVGPSDVPPIEPGRYYVTLYNPSLLQQQYFIIATLGIGQIQPVDFNGGASVPLLDDAVTYASIFNFFTPDSTNETIAAINVGIRVDHSRISDLVFTLISPDKTRYLLMENRGNTSTNGAGLTLLTTNIANVASTGSSQANTNFVPVGLVAGTLNINYDFYFYPDQMTVYLGTNNFAPPIYDTGMIGGSGQTNITFPAGTGYLTIIMNQFGNTNGPPGADRWTYSAGGVQTNFVYLTFTDDTNLTTTPIKFAPTPFVPPAVSGILWTDSFEAYPTGTYPTPTSFGGGWIVATNSVKIVTTPPAFDGNNSLQLDNGAVYIVLTNTVAGQQYVLNYELGSRLVEGGGPVTNANWQPQSVAFIAPQNNTRLVLNASGTALPFASTETLNFDTNTLLDAFTLSAVPGNLHYQPEESLDPLIGTSAYGTWQLEIQDDRVGATNLAPALLGWQLQFIFANTNPAAEIVTPGTGITNTVPANGIIWYQVSVPTNADFATNTLIFADAPVNLLFNQTTSDTNGASILLANSTGGSNILSATTTPPLVPGATYFLGVQNPNNFPVNFGLEVDFHLTSATTPPIDFSSIIYTNGGYLLTWFAPSNDLFQVQWSDNLPPVTWNTFTNIIGFNPAAFTGAPLTQFNFFDDGSQTPPGLPPIRFYNLVLLGSFSNLTNGVPQTNTVPAGETAFYVVNVPANADFATNTLLFATPPGVNLLFNQTGFPTGTNAGGFTLLASSTGGSNILSATSVPPLMPGATYYLGVQNTNSFPVTFAVQVDFHLTNPTTTFPISNITFTNGYYLLTWFAPSNDLFQVQWSDSLAPLNWNTFTNIISFNPAAFTGGPLTQFNFIDDGSQTGGLPPIRFYNLILLGSESNSTNGVPATNTVPAGETAFYVVNVPANADFATNTLLFAGTPVNLLFNQAGFPAGTNAGGFTLLANSTGGSNILSAASLPPLVPGATYYLGVQNTNSFPVNFALQVDFHLKTVTFPSEYPVSGVAYTNGNFVLTWLAPTNDIFTVQVATNLSAPIAWQTLATNITYNGPLTNMNGLFSYTDNGPFASPFRFYQLLLTGVAAPGISGFTFTTNGLNLTWSAPTNDQFQVAWATNLVPPVSWTPFLVTITSTNGTFSFTDTNAPLLVKFYELILLP